MVVVGIASTLTSEVEADARKSGAQQGQILEPPSETRRRVVELKGGCSNTEKEATEGSLVSATIKEREWEKGKRNQIPSPVSLSSH